MFRVDHHPKVPGRVRTFIKYQDLRIAAHDEETGAWFTDDARFLEVCSISNIFQMEDLMEFVEETDLPDKPTLLELLFELEL